MDETRRKSHISEKRRNIYKSKSQKKLSKLELIIILILLIILIYSASRLFTWIYDNYSANNLKNELSQYIDTTSNNHTDNKDNINTLSVDFESLEKINKDVVGWIKVNNTDINYPVVKYKDNEYYLNRDFKNFKNSSGAIFLDYKNDINNLSKNNVIYGHNRLDNSMFGSLKKILNKNWYENENNKIIYIYTKNSILSWQVFSVYKIPNETYYITTSFKNNEFLEFLKTIKERSIYDFGIDVNIYDNILTLSTCYGYNDSQRVVLHAKLIK